MDPRSFSDYDAKKTDGKKVFDRGSPGNEFVIQMNSLEGSLWHSSSVLEADIVTFFSINLEPFSQGESASICSCNILALCYGLALLQKNMPSSA